MMREGVVLFIEDDQGRIAMQLRDGGGFSGTWGLFGGWLDPGETHDQAVLREMKEELALELRSGALTYLGPFEVESLQALAQLYHYPISTAEIDSVVLNEGADWRMVDRDEMGQMPIVDVYRDYLDWFWARSEG